MAGTETMVNSYDAGHQPFNHDPKRGKWEGRWDFYIACLPNVFAIRSFLIYAAYFHFFAPGYSIFPIFIGTFLFIMPVFFVQSFLGQFSSTGFISVFRISPLFKGIGYVILALNLVTAIYSSSIAAFPLLFLLKSFQLSATWMTCGNSWNTDKCIEQINASSIYPYISNNMTDSMDPQYEYYVREVLKLTDDSKSSDVSWTSILGQLVVWVLVWCIIFRGFSTFSRFLRYSVLTCSILVTIIFIRVCFLPDIGKDTSELFTMDKPIHWADLFWWFLAPYITAMTLSRGWGATLTMASFQPFKANTERYSFIVPLVLTGLTVANGYLVTIIDSFISRSSNPPMYYHDDDLHSYFFVAIPYFCGRLEVPQMWSIMFFLMFFLSELSLVVIQTFSTITAITDEYAWFRERRYQLSAGLCGVSFALSIFFATEYLAVIWKRLMAASYVNQMVICFVEVMIVVWIYGRERFMRDVQFMLASNIAAWKFYIVRFVAPVYIVFLMLMHLGNSINRLHYYPTFYTIYVIFFKAVPWVVIPGYAIFKLVTSTGTLSERFRRCVRPNDWYPADPADKHKYELALGTSDVSQQLLEMNDNNAV